MPLVKAQCTNCGGVLEVDNGKDAAICPYCNTPYIVEQAINKFNVGNASINVQSANINVSGHLDADTMFENWLVTKDDRLKNDFMYYYATDSRKDFFPMITGAGFLDPTVNLDKAEELINRCLAGDRFTTYRNEYLAEIYKRRRTKEHDKKVIMTFLVISGVVILICLIVAGIFS